MASNQRQLAPAEAVLTAPPRTGQDGKECASAGAGTVTMSGSCPVTVAVQFKVAVLIFFPIMSRYYATHGLPASVPS